MIYDLELAGVHIRCDIPFDLRIVSSANEFMHAAVDMPDRVWDYEFRFMKTEQLPPMGSAGHFSNDRTYVDDADGFRVYFHSCPQKPPYACVLHNGRELICLYLENAEQYMNLSDNIFSLLSLEYFCYEIGGFLIHSSFIRTMAGEGILFSAAPGTGKSTQAELWQKYRGAEIINGDRAAVRMAKTDELTAYGLPYAGSSGIYRNESAPVKAIVALKQAPYNKVTRLHGAQIVRYLFSEVMVHRWNPVFSSEILDRILQLSVPVYLLECTPDEGAVAALEAKMSEKPDRGTDHLS